MRWQISEADHNRMVKEHPELNRLFIGLRDYIARQAQHKLLKYQSKLIKKEGISALVLMIKVDYEVLQEVTK